MEFVNLSRPVNDKKLVAGNLLIAEPFLADPNFSRAVILLCEHNGEGSVGFVLNRPIQISISDLLPNLASNELNVSQGGPVQLDTLHMLHRLPSMLGGNEIAKGVYWGGSYETLEKAVYDDSIPHNTDLKLFLGYSGWAAGQLEKEIEEGSWMVVDATRNILFETEPKSIWKSSIGLLGAQYGYLANMPLNPQLN
jgi:putative transcriptional regulator